MSATSRYVLVLPLLLGAAGCSRDLGIPQAPQRGSLVGRIDTGGRRDPGNRDVTLVSAAGSKRTAQTDATGAFAFDDLAPGAYIVDVRVTGFAPLVEAGVVISPGAATDLGVLSLTWLEGSPALGGVRGVVEIQGGVGDPTGGTVEFTAQGETTPWSSAVISFGGAFELRLPPGTWTLRAKHPWFVTSAPSAELVVPEGQLVNLPAALVMEVNPATVTGTVRREVDRAAPVNAAGALVTFDTGDTTTTDATGRFQVQGLPAGRRSFRVTLAGYHDEVAAHEVNVAGGATVDAGEVPLALDRGSISGTVVMGDQQPLRDVDVFVEGTPYATSVSQSPSAPERGSFTLRGVPVGVYTVSATRTRYSRQQATSITVRRDGDSDVGTLTLGLLSGDFAIDDGVAGNAEGYARRPQVSLDFSRFTNAVRVRFAQDDPTLASATWQTATPSATYSLTGADGTKTVYAQYEDTAGQVSAVFEASVVLDTTPPGSASVVLAGGADFTNQSQVLSVSVFAADPKAAGVDAVSGVTKLKLSTSNALDANGELSGPRDDYRLDTSFARPAPQADGPQRLYAQFIDAAGNLSAVVSDDVTIDTVAPTGSLVIAAGPRATSAEFTDTLIAELRLSVPTEPNGGYVQVRLANAVTDVPQAPLQAARASVAWFLDPAGEGLKTVAFELVDAAGNRTTGTPDTITYDVTPPTATAALVGSTPTRDAGVTLQVTASDSNGLSPTQALTASEDTFFAAAGTTTPAPFGSGQVSLALSPGDGPKSIYVRARDVAGNDAVARVAVELDTTPPTGSITLTGSLADGTPSTTVTTSTTVTVTLLAAGATRYLLVDGAQTSCPDPTATSYAALTTSTVSHVLTGSGSPRTVRACLADAAGNTRLTSAVSINFDATAPASCSLTLSGRSVGGATVPPDGLGVRRTALRDVDATISCGGGEVPAAVYFTQGSVTCTATAPLAWVPWSSQRVSLTGGDGAITVSGCVRDAAGNAASLASGAITLDTTPPQGVQVTIEDGATWFNEALRSQRGGFTAKVRGTSTDAVRWAVAESPPTSGVVAFSASTPVDVALTTGQGTATVWAVFEDALGNVSAPVADTIVVDTAAPATTTALVTVVSPTANGFTNTPVVNVLVRAPDDAAGVQLGQAAAATCVTGDVSSDSVRQVVGSYVLSLTGVDGLKTVCARFQDAAGNTSSLVSGTVTLDTTPPGTPQIVTPSRTASLADGATFWVNTAAGVTEANFDRYEKQGGGARTWVQADLAQTQTLFQFTLANTGDETGTPNVLRLRARDRAGNLSGEDLVVITADTNAPPAVTMDPTWVDNGDGQVTFWWRTDLATAADVAGFEVSYGNTPSVALLNGTYAAQGASPVQVPLQSGQAGTVTSSFTLSSLPNGTPTYVSVRPVDRAGNKGPPQATPLTLQPNEVSPTLVSTTSLPATALNILRMRSVGDTLYVVSASAAKGCFNSGVQLHAIDVSGMQSPIQGNRIQATPSIPSIRWSTAVFADAVPCTGSNGEPVVDLAIDGPYAFLASGPYVRIFDLVKAAATPADRLVATLNVTALPGGAAYQARSVFPRGGRLVIQGGVPSGALFATVMSLAKLFDANAATTVSLPTDVIGTGTLASFGGSHASLLTRDRLVAFVPTAGSYHGLRLGDAFDEDGGTTFDGTDTLYGTFQTGLVSPTTTPPHSGNYLYLAGASGGMTLFDLNTAWGTPATPISGVMASAFPAVGQYEVHGSQAFVTTNGFLRILELSELSDIRETCVYDTGVGNSTTGVHVMGPYAAVGIVPPTQATVPPAAVQFLELATPRAPRVRRTGVGAGARPEVRGSFVFTSEGKSFDTQATPLARTWDGTSFCTSSASARIDDLEVLAAGSKLTVWNLERGVDRVPGTAPVAGIDSYDVTLPAGVRATDVAAWGNFLVVAEVRTDGLYLEVFDATRLRDRDPFTFLSTGDSRGAVRVTSTAPSALTFAYVSLHAGRALLVLDDQAYPVGVNQGGAAWVVDLRALFDDAAGLPSTDAVQATLTTNIGRVRAGAIHGGRLWLATVNEVLGYDVALALDEDPLTKVTGPTFPPVKMGENADDLQVTGSYLFTSAGNLKPMRVYDVSSPTLPELVSQLPLNTNTGPSCTIDGSSRTVRTGVTQVGSRAWVTTPGAIRELDLE